MDGPPRYLRDLAAAEGLDIAGHAWGMAATPYGETLVRYARGLTAELDEARHDLAALASGAEGSLRVGGVTGAMPGLLAPALRRMQAERPRVSIFVLVLAQRQRWTRAPAARRSSNSSPKISANAS